MKKVCIILTLIALMCTAESCKKEGKDSNPFFTRWDTQFGVPPFDKIKTEHYRPAFDSAMVLHLAQIDSIVTDTAGPGFENTILALDNSGEMLHTVANVFFSLTAADTNPQMQAIEEEVSPLLTAHQDKISMNKELFAKIKTVYDNRSSLKLDPMQLRLTEKTYKDFVRFGAGLSEDDMARLKEVNEQISSLTVKFTNNLLAETKSFILEVDSAGIKGLPRSVVDAAAATAKEMDKKGWVFTLNKPSLIPFITYADDRDLREKLYKGYLDRCNYDNDTDNKQVINDITRLRIERANLLGFPSHSAWVLDDEMAKTPANVYSLLDELWKPALERAKAELDDMKEIKKAETGDDSFESWDWWYYAEKVRKAKYDLDEEMLRPYLSLENVRAGIFELCNRLYGITFRPVALPVYNKECQTYEVLDIDNSHLAVLYMDFFPRDGKGQGAWCGGFREQSYKDGKRVAPVVTITCNFTRPNGNAPALLNLDETETFFHEFGHAVHSFFGDVPYKGLGNVERDFVELPSQIMENWCLEPQMLKKYARHYSTGEAMPDYLIEKIRKSTLFNQGFASIEYLAASYTDMDLHTLTKYVPFDVNKFEENALNTKRGLIKEIAPRYRYPYFKHIFSDAFGYSSGYYSYIWAEVLDQDAYAAFVDSGDIFNKDIAASLRKNLLSKGGMADGMTLYKNFRGQEPDRLPLLRKRGLIEEPLDPTEPMPDEVVQ